MSNLGITTIRKDGDDWVFNDSFSVPANKISIVKRDEDFLTLFFDQKYYAESQKIHVDFLDIFWQNVTRPASVDSNDELFEKLVNLK